MLTTRHGVAPPTIQIFECPPMSGSSTVQYSIAMAPFHALTPPPSHRLIVCLNFGC